MVDLSNRRQTSLISHRYDRRQSDRYRAVGGAVSGDNPWRARKSINLGKQTTGAVTCVVQRFVCDAHKIADKLIIGH